MIDRLKLLLLILFSVFILFMNDPIFLSVILAGLIIFSLFVKTKKKLWERIKPLLIIAFLVIVFQVLFNYSENLSKRIYNGLISSEKIMLLSLSVFIYTLTTSLSRTINSLSFIPGRIRLALIITLGLIPVIIEEIKKISLVQKVRGHKTRGFNIFGSFLPIIIPLMHNTIRRAEQLSIVLVSKGYEEQ